MARWEVKEPPVMIPVFVEHYDKILDEIADLLYHYVCKSQGQWLDPIQQNSTVNGLNQTPCLLQKEGVKPRRRTAS